MREKTTQTTPSQEHTTTTALLNIGDVASLLNCSARHVYRLVDTRRIPQPIKLGAILRWVKADFEQWIANGCQDCRKR